MNKSKLILAILTLIVFIVPGSAYAQNNDELFTIGLLIYFPDTFIEEMTALGYVEGENVNYMRLELADVEFDRIFEEIGIQTQAMIDANVDLLIANTDTDAVNLRAQTPDIPILFVISDDPVATGAVADLTRPGGNTSGVVSNQHHPRRLQLLTEINPTITKIYYLYSSLALEGETIFTQVQELGEELGVEVIGAPIADLETGLESLENAPEDIDWLFLTPYVPFDRVEFADALLATSTGYQAGIAGFFVAGPPVPGYLITYGPDLIITTQQTAQLADRIIRGASAGDLPVVIAENSLVVNLEVAEALDKEIPIAILRQADLIVRPGDSEDSGD